MPYISILLTQYTNLLIINEIINCQRRIGWTLASSYYERALVLSARTGMDSRIAHMVLWRLLNARELLWIKSPYI